MEETRRQIILTVTFTIIAQTAGFVKLWLIAYFFGVDARLDGYYLALSLPTLISSIFSGIIQTGIFPVRAQLAVKSSDEMVHKFERMFLVLTAMLGISWSILFFLFREPLETLIVGDSSLLVRDAFRFMWPYAIFLIAFNITGDLLGYLLAMRNRYAYVPLGGLINAIVSGIVLLLWSEKGLWALAFGTVLGAISQVVVNVILLLRSDFVVFGPLPNKLLAAQKIRELVYIGGWIIPGLFLSNALVSIPVIFLREFGDGAVSSFSYAYRFHLQFLQLTVMAISPLLLANFSEMVARNNYKEIEKWISKSMRLSVLLGGGSLILIGSVGPFLLDILFGGRFDMNAAYRVGLHWWLLTIGLGFAVMGNVYAKLWQARKKVKQMSALAGFSLMVFIISYAITRSWMGEFSVSLSLSISNMVVTVIFWLSMRREQARLFAETN